MSDEEMHSEEEDPYSCGGDDEDRDVNYIPETQSKKSKVTKKAKQQQKARNKQKVKATLAEKKQLARLVDKENPIWDLKNKLHSNKFAITAAWKRIAEEMNRSSKFVVVS